MEKNMINTSCLITTTSVLAKPLLLNKTVSQLTLLPWDLSEPSNIKRDDTSVNMRTDRRHGKWIKQQSKSHECPIQQGRSHVGGGRDGDGKVAIRRGKQWILYQHSHLSGRSGAEMAIESVKYLVKCCCRYLRWITSRWCSHVCSRLVGE